MNPNIPDKNLWFHPGAIRVKQEPRLRTNDLCHVFGRVDTGRIIAGPEVRPDYDDQAVDWWHIEFAEQREWHPSYQITKTWRNEGIGQPITPPTIDTSCLGRGEVTHGE